MSDELYQKISQLLDDDLGVEDALDLLERMKLDNELQNKISRYELITHALREDAYIPVKSQFAQEISLQIQKEPIHFLPNRKFIVPSMFKWTALAASIAIIAVLSIPEPPEMQVEKNPFVAKAETAPVPASKPQALAAIPSSAVAYNSSEPPDSSQARFAEYLRAHNSSRYLDSSVQIHPYARVANFNQE